MSNPHGTSEPTTTNQTNSGPTLRDIAGQATVSAFIIGTLLLVAFKIFVPIDSTGSFEGDAMNDAKVPFVLAATAFGTVSLTAIHIIQWRRNAIKNRQNASE